MTTEEIKRALQCCVGINGGCDDCPCRHTYYEEDNCRQIMIDSHNAIVELEKRNEPMNPLIRIDKNGIHLACAKCGEILETLIDGEAISMNPWKWNYCRVCGQAVKWE